LKGAVDQQEVAWREDIDALVFIPEGHQARCVVHRLAFRKLLRSPPVPQACIAYFVAHRQAFQAAAAMKMTRQNLVSRVNFHLTSRDLAGALSSSGWKKPEN
jgi:hypothetical protein